MRYINAGGTALIIIILVLHEPRMADPLGKNNNENSAGKSEHGIIYGDFLPPKMRMFIGENKSKNARETDTDEEKSP